MISVAIPTHNRANVLRQTLEQLTRLSIPEGVDWELIVVQNNCTDDTAVMLGEFHARLPLRTLSEPRPGVNHARISAVAAARGDCIVFTDDDTLPMAGWMAAYASAFEAHTDVGVFGGPISPRFPCEPPPWLQAVLPLTNAAYGGLEARGRGVSLGATFFPFGANMAFRTTTLRDRQFDLSLGPKGTSRINGSETELILHLFANGQTGIWVEEARVVHCIQPKQMTTDFLRWYWTGQGAGMAASAMSSDTKLLWGRPRWLWRDALEAELLYRSRSLSGDPNVWVSDLKRASIARGLLTGRGGTIA